MTQTQKLHFVIIFIKKKKKKIHLFYVKTGEVKSKLKEE